MKRLTTILITNFMVFLGTGGFGEASVEIDMVTVGNTGNAADGTGYGSVGYEYHIGTYEVTNGQYVVFLNQVAQTDTHGLYDELMGSNSRGGIERSGTDGNYVYTTKSGFENKPVNFVSFADAARFTNWLTNGQGNTSTEWGAYDMSQPLDTITRLGYQPGQEVQYFISSEDEWYKAAYYDPTLNDGSGGYWTYPTQSNGVPTASSPSSLPNRANYGSVVNNVTDVGAYTGSVSYYGTFDQEGNVAEFMDTIMLGGRVRRGSALNNTLTGSGSRTFDIHPLEAGTIGFRVVMVQVPEPGTTALVLLSALGLGVWILRKKVTG